MTLGGRLALLFSICCVIGALIGAGFGSPGVGALIGLAVPLLFTAGVALAVWVFIKMLGSLFKGG